LLFIAGICLMLLGVALRWYSVSVLGKYFTFDVAIHSGQVLVEVGPYRYIRHPSSETDVASRAILVLE